MQKSEFLCTALEAAKQAQKIIMDYYTGEIKVDIKPDMTPVTLADSGAEKIIINTIKQKFPEHGFIGEETGTQNKESEYQWIIDPIDGTKNYMRKIPLFATQIALMKNNEIILGVSNAPALNELIYTEKDKGAFMGEKQLKVSSITSLSDAYLSFGSPKYFEKNGHTKALLSLANKVLSNRGIGDAWSYHLLAQGKIDIMVEASTNIWDIAAVKIIVEEAGGKVTTLTGGPVDKNTHSIIATNGKLHDLVAREFV